MRCFSLAALLLAASYLPAAAAPDPLRLIPAEASLVFKVEKPRALVETVRKLGAYRDYAALPQVREALESTTAKRLFQMLEHAETKLGKKWPELLDAAAGGGIALGNIAGQNHLVAAIQGTDEAAVGELFQLAMQLLGEELTRQANAEKPIVLKPTMEGGAEVLRVGNDFFLARRGAVLIASNHAAGFDKALELAAAKSDAGSVLPEKNLAEAKKLIGAEPLAWFWFNLGLAKKDKALNDFLESGQKDFLGALVIGGSLNAIRRSDYLAAGLFETKTGLKFSLALPAKRADLPREMAVHIPMKPDVPGSLPLLVPQGVLYTQSFYLDLAAMWDERKDFFNEQVRKDIVEKAETDISKFLPGTTFSKLLQQSGPHHRFVMVERGNSPYKTKPEYPLPEMAIVSSMRDPQFGKQMNSTIRSAMALLSLQLGLKMTEEKVGGIEVVSYAFPDKPVADDPTNYRFNFTPSYAIVNGSVVAASSPQLVKDLIPLLQKPVDPKDCSREVWRGKAYGSGAAKGVLARPEGSIAEAILNSGIDRKEAEKQVAQLAKFYEALGTITLSIDHASDAVRYELELKVK